MGQLHKNVAVGIPAAATDTTVISPSCIGDSRFTQIRHVIK